MKMDIKFNPTITVYIKFNNDGKDPLRFDKIYLKKLN